MRVEWVGGPRDGEVFDAPEGMYHIEVPQMGTPCVEMGGGMSEAPVKVVSLQVQRRRDGTCFVRWPYRGD